MNMQKTSNVTLDEWYAALNKESDKPENSFNVDDFAAKFNISRSRATERLSVLVENGKLIKGKYKLGSNIKNWYMPVELYNKEKTAPNGKTNGTSQRASTKKR